ncbi:MAG: ATP-binding protein [Gammaproteobacteria bacterium]
MSTNDFSALIGRIDKLLDKVESTWLPQSQQPDWQALAFLWRKPGYLQAVKHPRHAALDDLLNIDKQKALLERNTRQFLRGLPSNNVLLSGSRGTGKSTLVRALLTKYATDGLRLIEVDRQHLVDLPDIVDPLYGRPERFIIFTDDLSFEAGDPSYKALKAMLDGSIAAAPDNVVIYATSNRRHLMPEYHHENRDARNVEGEIHLGEAVEEKISLSERFGLWMSFYPFKQEEYLRIVFSALDSLRVPLVDEQTLRAEALRWALQRGSRSGRVAQQFARDWAGRGGLETLKN